MQDKKWEFLLGESVYIYPSANSDDGGDVNTEDNIAEITRKLIQKNFVIRRTRKETDKPLFVEKSGNTTITVTPGEACIEGYYLDLISDDTYLCELDIKDMILASDLDTYIGKFNDYIAEYLPTLQSNENPYEVAKTKMNKDDYKEFCNKLPRLHVIIKLLRNNTGNVRGDITESYFDPAQSKTVVKRVCKGMAISVLTDDELAALTVPYLELAYMIPVYPASSANFVINVVINDNSKYAYIHESSIYNDDNITIQEWVEEYVQYNLRHLDTITYFKTETVGGKSVTYKYLELTVRDGIVHTIRYTLNTPVTYDENGEPLVTAVTEYDASYDIDYIQWRTHPSSTRSPEPTNEPAKSYDAKTNTLAHTIDSTDNGSGLITCDTVSTSFEDSSGTAISATPSTTNNNNGKSRLIARADHNHDNRYILSALSNLATTIYQKISSSLKIVGSLIVSGNTDVGGNATVTGTISNAAITADPSKIGNTATTTRQDCAVQITGSVNATGYISATRVYNAVWNDYAEMYKKKDSREDIKPGTVICKVRDESTYTTSTYRNRKLVVGVCSDSYGHLLGGDAERTMEENLRMYIPVALAGRVYVNIVPGTHVIEGDLMAVSPVDGCAEPCEFTNEVVGTIVGKALETVNRYEGDKVDKVLIQVSLM